MIFQTHRKMLSLLSPSASLSTLPLSLSLSPSPYFSPSVLSALSIWCSPIIFHQSADIGRYSPDNGAGLGWNRLRRQGRYTHPTNANFQCQHLTYQNTLSLMQCHCSDPADASLLCFNSHVYVYNNNVYNVHMLLIMKQTYKN